MSTDAARMARSMRGATKLIDVAMTRTTGRYAQLLRTRVRANASGRPGPRRQSGDYRRTIAVETGKTNDGTHYALVGTNSPQARRLELGFVGVDAIGRTYQQSPLPHFGPALDVTGPQYEAAIVADVDTILGTR